MSFYSGGASTLSGLDGRGQHGSRPHRGAGHIAVQSASAVYYKLIGALCFE